MLEDQFRELWRNPDIKKKITAVIDFILPQVDFSKTTKYKIKNGNIYDCLFNVERWSWMNSINTNYSCIFKLIEEINRTSERLILYDDFINNPDEIIEYLKSKLLENKQIYFTPGSSVFKTMFFITQNTWNSGFLSVLSGIFTISKKYTIKVSNLGYKRGDIDDMNKGCDLIIYINGKENITQHKKANLFKKEEYYISTTFVYTESSYRNNLNFISIDTGDYIYLFNHSKDNKLCGNNKSGKFFIHESLLMVPPMEKENKEITDLLLELNKLCLIKKIIFEFEKNDSNENYFEDKTEKNIRTIRCFINDLDDSKLIDKIKSQIKKLQ